LEEAETLVTRTLEDYRGIPGLKVEALR